MKKSWNESFVDHNLRVSCLISGDLSIVVDGSSRLTVLNSVDVWWRRERWCSLVTRSAWVAADTIIAETWSNVYIWVSLVMRTQISRKFQWCQGLMTYRVLWVNVGVLVLITRSDVASSWSVVRSTESAANITAWITAVVTSIVGNRVVDSRLLG